MNKSMSQIYGTAPDGIYCYDCNANDIYVTAVAIFSYDLGGQKLALEFGACMNCLRLCNKNSDIWVRRLNQKYLWQIKKLPKE